MTFKCINCGKEKDESELGSINRLSRIGFAVIFVPFVGQSVCEKCVTQVSVAGFFAAIMIGMAIIGLLVHLLS
jgi:hypothetical protein